MASCCCHNLCAHDCCLLAQGAFGSPRTISALWSSESGKPYQCQAMQTQPWAKKLSFQWKIHAHWICAGAEERAWPSCWQIQRGTSVDSSEEEDWIFFFIVNKVNQKGMAFISAFLCLQQVREEGRVWHDLQWSEHVRNHRSLGAEQVPTREKR